MLARQAASPSPYAIPALQMGPRLSQLGVLWEFLDSKGSGRKVLSLVFRVVVWLGLLRAPAQAAGRKFHSSPHAPFSITNNDMRLRPHLCHSVPPLRPQGRMPPAPPR